MSHLESTFAERQLMKDPNTATSRIFVGSIPHENVTRQDIEDVFSRFGKVVGVVLNRGFGFVQFEEERSATEAINTSEISFKNRRLDVKQARVFKGSRDDRDREPYWDDRDREKDRDRDRHPERDTFREDRERDTYRDRSPIDDRTRDRRDDRDWRGRDRYEGFGKAPPTERDRFYEGGRDRFRDIDYRDSRALPDRYRNQDEKSDDAPSYRADLPDARSLPIQTPNMDRANDCEIIVINKKQTRYAEYIELQLKKLGLTVDILFPNEDVQMSRVLGNISSRGSLYAIMIEPINEDHQSLTLNILHGIPEAHRNMPLVDAIKLIDTNFEAYLKSQKGLSAPATRGAVPVPVSVSVPVVGAPIKVVQEKHPDALQVLLNLLADNRTLTVLQYDKVISYLKERREQQVQIELGESEVTTTHSPVVASTAPPASDKQAELQNRIMSILSGKAGSIVSSAPSVAPVMAPAPVPAAMPALSAPLSIPAAAPITVSAPSVLGTPSLLPAAPVSSSVSSVPAPSIVPAGAWNPPKPPTSDAHTPILSDPNVQKALDSLMQGNLLQRLVGGGNVSNASPATSLSSAGTGLTPSGPLFTAYANSNSNHVGGRRF